MEIKKITIEEVRGIMNEGSDFILLDVLPPEYYEAEHIKGALNAPVYEIVFLDYIKKITDDKEKRIVVYNDRQTSLAAEDAARKLIDAGFKNIEIFQGGLSLWREAGLPMEKGKSVEMPQIVDGNYALDTEASIIGWTGRNFKYAHRGKIRAKSGMMIFESGKLSGGEVILDMETIKDEDLSDETMRGYLEHHLKSSDFFDVGKYPEVRLDIKKAERIEGALPGTPNYQITASLLIKETAREISFPAMIAPMEGGVINIQFHFDFDRTLWQVRYGSEKFFEKLGMHLVNDIISMEVFLVTKKI